MQCPCSGLCASDSESGCGQTHKEAMAAVRRKKHRNSRTGLALGGGGARGLSHIGILRELTRLGIEPDIICGTSIGALIGASFITGHLDFIEATFRDLRKRDIVRYLDISIIPGLGWVEGHKIMSFFKENMGEVEFKDLAKTFAVVATDITHGKEVVLEEGSMWDAVRASISLPGIFRPVKVGDRWLVDGGLVNPVPVSLCRSLGADRIIAVNLCEGLIQDHVERHGKRARIRKVLVESVPDRMKGTAESLIARVLDPTAPPGMFDILADSINIMQTQIARSRLQSEKPDILLVPDVGTIGILEFDRSEDAIEAGRACVRNHGGFSEFTLG